MLIQYEDVVDDTASIITEICRFLFGRDPEPHHLQELISAYEGYKRQAESRMEKYPRGWTGYVGVWEKYFSEKNKNSYNEHLNAFSKLHVRGQDVLELYPVFDGDMA